MTAQRFSASARIPAPASLLYTILADYQHGHPQILPRPPFVSLVVEQGGTGAGSVLRVQMRVLGQVQTFRTVVSEPEPGRVLVETNDTGYVTTFTSWSCRAMICTAGWSSEPSSRCVRPAHIRRVGCRWRSSTAR